MQAPHGIPNEVARQIDAVLLRNTTGESFEPITAENILRARALLESGKAGVKTVFGGGFYALMLLGKPRPWHGIRQPNETRGPAAMSGSMYLASSPLF